jgi:hypothetical protein
MTDSAAAVITALIIIPIVVLLIHAGFRNFFASARNLKEAVEGQLAGRRKPDEDQPRSGKTVQSEQQHASAVVSELMAEFQAQAKRSDQAHKARIRAHVDRKIPPISDDGRKMIERALRARLAIKHIFPPRLRNEA